MEKHDNDITTLNEQQDVEQTKSPSSKGKARKIIGIVFDVVLYAFLALCLLTLVLTLVAKRQNNDAVVLFGHEMRRVVTDSMQKSEYSVDVSEYEIRDIPIQSMVFIERVPDDEAAASEWYGKLKVGDVLTFRYVVKSSQTQEYITHRIVNIKQTATGYVITLKGDNRSSENGNVDEQVIYTSYTDAPSYDYRNYNYVVGKVVGQSVALGRITYGVTTPVGLALIIIVPCSAIIIWQVVRIVNAVNEDKKRKNASKIEQAESQAKELEELKRKLAELESGKATDEKEADDVDGN